jgi:hypothetical protein
MNAFRDGAPEILREIEAAKVFVNGLDEASDLIEVACSSATLATLALDVHLKREGKDNHARAFLETAYWLQVRLAELVEVWKAIESAGEIGE